MIFRVLVAEKRPDALLARTMDLNKSIIICMFIFQTYGSSPSKAETTAAGESCPICQDNYKDAVKLTCKVRKISNVFKND